MNKINYITIVALSLFLSCSNMNTPQTDVFNLESTKITENLVDFVEISDADITITNNLDYYRIDQGKRIFNKLCTDCHKTDENFIGPALKNVYKRREPQWIMNMILNPDRWVVEDSTASRLFKEYNGSPMVNQGLTIDEARNVLEYLRTLQD